MRVDDVKTLFAYDLWATERILRAAAALTPEEFAAPRPYSHGGLRGTLVHTLSAVRTWRLRVSGESPSAFGLRDEDFPTVESLAEAWRAEAERMRAYLDTLADADLDRVISYRRLSGDPMASVLWHILTHVVTHGMQHRAEAAVMLTDLGHSPGDIDLILFTRERT